MKESVNHHAPTPAGSRSGGNILLLRFKLRNTLTRSAGDKPPPKNRPIVQAHQEPEPVWATHRPTLGTQFLRTLVFAASVWKGQLHALKGLVEISGVLLCKVRLVGG